MEITNDTSIMTLARVDNKYLGSEELPQNKDLIAEIVKIVQEPVLNPKNNKTSVKTIVYFKDLKPIVANKTNLTAIHRGTKAETIGEVVGHKVALYRDPSVKFGTKVTGGIRISPYAVDSDEYKRDSENRDSQYGRQKPIYCEACGNEIRGAGGKTPREIADFAKKTYKKELCVNCMNKINKENK